MAKKIIGKTNGFCTLPIYIITAHVFFPYWRRREPPASASIADFHSAFIAKVKKHKLHTHWQNFLSEKTNGFCTLPIYLITAHVFSHYWRRREPPVCLRSDHFHLAFIAKLKKHKLHTHWQKFLPEKQMVFALCPFT